MFSGKTEELIRRLNRAMIARQKIEIFKPRMDRRYSEEMVISHSKRSIRSNQVDFAEDMLLRSGHCQVIGIDEAQFFDDNIVDVCEKMANGGKRVIIAGLDLDYNGEPFGSMPILMAKAEYVYKMHAICMVCGNLASYSYRLNECKDQVVIGAKDCYEPRCRSCFFQDM
jgi:thymidine kinase